MNVTKLPQYTKKLTLAGRILDTQKGRIEGFTQGLDLRSAPSTGYMVGTGNGEFNAKGLSFQKIKSKVNQIFNSYSEQMFLGAWNNENDTIVEISRHIEDLETALKVGKLGNQIAIWDLKNKKEIKL